MVFTKILVHTKELIFKIKALKTCYVIFKQSHSLKVADVDDLLCLGALLFPSTLSSSIHLLHFAEPFPSCLTSLFFQTASAPPSLNHESKKPQSWLSFITCLLPLYSFFHLIPCKPVLPPSSPSYFFFILSPLTRFSVYTRRPFLFSAQLLQQPQPISTPNRLSRMSE